MSRHLARTGSIGALLAVALTTVTTIAVLPASAVDIAPPTAPQTAPATGQPEPDPTVAPTVTPTVTPTPTLPPVPPPPPPPPPVATTVLPALADVVPTYQAQRSCDPAAKPGVEAYVRMVLQTYRVGRNGGIVRGCGIGATSEHKEGRAFDYMLSVNVPQEKAVGDALTGWLTGPDAAGVVGGNARRIGVMYLIWNRRIWSAYSTGTGWRAYYGPNPHTDHVHTSFSWNGAMARTSWWSGRTATVEDRGPCGVYAGQPAPVYTGPQLSACPTPLLSAPTSPYAIVWPGQSTSSVRLAQSQLGLAADGVFGAATRTALMGWQRTVALPVTGVLDKPTWARLAPPPPPASTPTASVPAAPVVVVPTTSLTPFKTTVLRPGSRGAAVAELQRSLKVTADGVFGDSTTAAVAAAQTRGSLRGTGVVDAATWAVVERQAHPLLDRRATVLRRFSTGPAVLALEQALALKAPDTFFGPATTSAVKAVQAAAGLAQTGIVDTATWAAVEAKAFPLGAVAATPAVLAQRTPLSAYTTLSLRRGAAGLVVTALQRSLGTKADGLFGSGTLSTVRAFQKARKLPATGVVDARTWASVEAVAYPLLPYRTVVLRVGSKGPAVAALQKALRQKADGVFAAPLLVTVTAMQTKNHLRATGVVVTSTWTAVEKAAYPLGVKRW